MASQRAFSAIRGQALNGFGSSSRGSLAHSAGSAIERGGEALGGEKGGALDGRLLVVPSLDFDRPGWDQVGE